MRRSASRAAATQPAASAPTEPPADLHQLPLAFVPNVGQSPDVVRFQVRAMGGTTFFTADELVLTLPAPQLPPTQTNTLVAPAELEASPRPAPLVVRQRFAGAARTPTISGVERLPGVVNYLLGDDPDQWHTQVPSYAGLAYRELYPGIDLAYTGTDGQLKRTYTLAAGADPSQIRWRYTGVSELRLDDTCALQASLPLPKPAPTITTGLTPESRVTASAVLTPSMLVEQAPIAWQDIKGRRVPVTVRYLIGQDQQVGFALGSYDRSQPLTIDPTLTYSSYLGGAGEDEGHGIAQDPVRALAIAIDATGAAYATGSAWTEANDFPPSPSAPQPIGGSSWDAFVAKLDPSGSDLVYATYLGGTWYEEGSSIALDTAGNAYVTGHSKSDNFPTTSGAFQETLVGAPCSNTCEADAFVARLNAAGTSFDYSTLLGGSIEDIGYGIVVDATAPAARPAPSTTGSAARSPPRSTTAQDYPARRI